MPRPSFYFRELYRRADRPLDLAAAKTAVTALALTASAAELTRALAELASVPYSPPTDDQLPQLRSMIERELHRSST